MLCFALGAVRLIASDLPRQLILLEDCLAKAETLLVISNA